MSRTPLQAIFNQRLSTSNPSSSDIGVFLQQLFQQRLLLPDVSITAKELEPRRPITQSRYIYTISFRKLNDTPLNYDFTVEFNHATTQTPETWEDVIRNQINEEILGIRKQIENLQQERTENQTNSKKYIAELTTKRTELAEQNTLAQKIALINLFLKKQSDYDIHQKSGTKPLSNDEKRQLAGLVSEIFPSMTNVETFITTYKRTGITNTAQTLAAGLKSRIEELEKRTSANRSTIIQTEITKLEDKIEELRRKSENVDVSRYRESDFGGKKPGTKTIRGKIKEVALVDIQSTHLSELISTLTATEDSENKKALFIHFFNLITQSTRSLSEKITLAFIAIAENFKLSFYKNPTQTEQTLNQILANLFQSTIQHGHSVSSTWAVSALNANIPFELFQSATIGCERQATINLPAAIKLYESGIAGFKNIHVDAKNFIFETQDSGIQYHFISQSSEQQRKSTKSILQFDNCDVLNEAITFPKIPALSRTKFKDFTFKKSLKELTDQYNRGQQPEYGAHFNSAREVKPTAFFFMNSHEDRSKRSLFLHQYHVQTLIDQQGQKWSCTGEELELLVTHAKVRPEFPIPKLNFKTLTVTTPVNIEKLIGKKITTLSDYKKALSQLNSLSTATFQKGFENIASVSLDANELITCQSINALSQLIEKSITANAAQQIEQQKQLNAQKEKEAAIATQLQRYVNSFKSDGFFKPTKLNEFFDFLTTNFNVQKKYKLDNDQFKIITLALKEFCTDSQRPSEKNAYRWKNNIFGRFNYPAGTAQKTVDDENLVAQLLKKALGYFTDTESNQKFSTNQVITETELSQLKALLPTITTPASAVNASNVRVTPPASNSGRQPEGVTPPASTSSKQAVAAVAANSVRSTPPESTSGRQAALDGVAVRRNNSSAVSLSGKSNAAPVVDSRAAEIKDFLMTFTFTLKKNSFDNGRLKEFQKFIQNNFVNRKLTYAVTELPNITQQNFNEDARKNNRTLTQDDQIVLNLLIKASQYFSNQSKDVADEITENDLAELSQLISRNSQTSTQQAMPTRLRQSVRSVSNTALDSQSGSPEPINPANPTPPETHKTIPAPLQLDADAAASVLREPQSTVGIAVVSQISAAQMTQTTTGASTTEIVAALQTPAAQTQMMTGASNTRTAANPSLLAPPALSQPAPTSPAPKFEKIEGTFEIHGPQENEKLSVEVEVCDASSEKKPIKITLTNPDSTKTIVQISYKDIQRAYTDERREKSLRGKSFIDELEEKKLPLSEKIKLLFEHISNERKTFFTLKNYRTEKAFFTAITRAKNQGKISGFTLKDPEKNSEIKKEDIHLTSIEIINNDEQQIDDARTIHRLGNEASTGSHKTIKFNADENSVSIEIDVHKFFSQFEKAYEECVQDRSLHGRTSYLEKLNVENLYEDAIIERLLEHARREPTGRTAEALFKTIRYFQNIFFTDLCDANYYQYSDEKVTEKTVTTRFKKLITTFANDELTSPHIRDFKNDIDKSEAPIIFLILSSEEKLALTQTLSSAQSDPIKKMIADHLKMAIPTAISRNHLTFTHLEGSQIQLKQTAERLNNLAVEIKAWFAVHKDNPDELKKLQQSPYFKTFIDEALVSEINDRIAFLTAHQISLLNSRITAFVDTHINNTSFDTLLNDNFFETFVDDVLMLPPAKCANLIEKLRTYQQNPITKALIQLLETNFVSDPAETKKVYNEFSDAIETRLRQKNTEFKNARIYLANTIAAIPRAAALINETQKDIASTFEQIVSTSPSVQKDVWAKFTAFFEHADSHLILPRQKKRELLQQLTSKHSKEKNEANIAFIDVLSAIANNAIEEEYLSENPHEYLTEKLPVSDKAIREKITLDKIAEEWVSINQKNEAALISFSGSSLNLLRRQNGSGSRTSVSQPANHAASMTALDAVVLTSLDDIPTADGDSSSINSSAANDLNATVANHLQTLTEEKAALAQTTGEITLILRAPLTKESINDFLSKTGFLEKSLSFENAAEISDALSKTIAESTDFLEATIAENLLRLLPSQNLAANAVAASIKSLNPQVAFEKWKSKHWNNLASLEKMMESPFWKFLQADNTFMAAIRNRVEAIKKIDAEYARNKGFSITFLHFVGNFLQTGNIDFETAKQFVVDVNHKSTPTKLIFTNEAQQKINTSLENSMHPSNSAEKQAVLRALHDIVNNSLTVEVMMNEANTAEYLNEHVSTSNQLLTAFPKLIEEKTKDKTEKLKEVTDKLMALLKNPIDNVNGNDLTRTSTFGRLFTNALFKSSSNANLANSRNDLESTRGSVATRVNLSQASTSQSPQRDNPLSRFQQELEDLLVKLENNIRNSLGDTTTFIACFKDLKNFFDRYGKVEKEEFKPNFTVNTPIKDELTTCYTNVNAQIIFYQHLAEQEKSITQQFVELCETLNAYGAKSAPVNAALFVRNASQAASTSQNYFISALGKFIEKFKKVKEFNLSDQEKVRVAKALSGHITSMDSVSSADSETERAANSLNNIITLPSIERQRIVLDALYNVLTQSQPSALTTAGSFAAAPKTNGNGSRLTTDAMTLHALNAN